MALSDEVLDSIGDEDVCSAGNELDDENDVMYAGENEIFEDELGEARSPSAGEADFPFRYVESLPDLSVATGSEALDTVTNGAECIGFTVSSKRLALLSELSGFRDSVVSVAFSYDVQYLAAASYDATVRLYSITNDDSSGATIISLVQTLEGPTDDVEFVRWHPKGSAVIAGSKDFTTWMWWAPTGRMMTLLTGHSGAVSCGEFVNDGKSIATGSTDGCVIVWNPKTGEKVHLFDRAEPRDSAATLEPVTCIAAHPTSPLLAFGSESGRVVLADSHSGHIVVPMHGHEDSVEALEFLDWEGASATYLASGSLDGTVRVWNCSRFTCRCILKHSAPPVVSEATGSEAPLSADDPAAQAIGGITKVRVIRNSCRLISAGVDSTLRLWDARDGRCIQILSGHRDAILDFAVVTPLQPSGATLIASCSDDKSLKVWIV